MRNVESLKSIGIYLNDNSEVFYPDFIMWLIAKNKVYINFIDPKGQMGTKDFATEQYKEKVTIADKATNPTLPNIEKELKRIHKKNFRLTHSSCFVTVQSLANIQTQTGRKKI